MRETMNAETDEIQFHTHTCQTCGSHWKHYSASGCTMQDTSNCGVCLSVKADEEDCGGAGRSEVTDTVLDCDDFLPTPSRTKCEARRRPIESTRQKRTGRSSILSLKRRSS